MAFWRKVFGPREPAAVTLRLTRQVIDLMSAGNSDEFIERTHFRDGVSIERARELVAQVRRLKRESGRSST